MTNKLFFKGIFAAFLLTATLHVSAQDSTKKAAPAKPAYNKPAAKPGATPVRVPQTATPAPTVSTGAARPYTPPVAAQPVQPNDRSIRGQYQYLLTKVYGYQRPMVEAFYKSLTDTLNAERKKIKPLQTNVTALKDTAKELHKQLASQQQTLDESSTKVDSISLLGISMTKSAYNTLMWGLVLVFGAVAAFVIFRSGSYSREAKYRIRLYDELDEEYKNYKAKANEKEKKLARELQTARNKLEELTGNPDY